MHTGQLLFLLFVSSAIQCSLQNNSFDLIKNPSSSEISSSMSFDLQDVLQLFTAKAPLYGSNIASTDNQVSLLGSELKELESLLDISLFTYLSNQIANHNDGSFVFSKNTSFNQNGPTETPEPFFQENEESFQLTNYEGNELYKPIRNIESNEQNIIDQYSEIPVIETLGVSETSQNVVIIDETIGRFFVPLVLSVIDELDKNSSTDNITVSSNTNAVQGSAFAALKGLYSGVDEVDSEHSALSFMGIKENDDEHQSVYYVCMNLVLLMILSTVIALRRQKRRKEMIEAADKEKGEEERSWYVEARDI